MVQQMANAVQGLLKKVANIFLVISGTIAQCLHKSLWQQMLVHKEVSNVLDAGVALLALGVLALILDP
jgi:hypothetical protein